MNCRSLFVCTMFPGQSYYLSVGSRPAFSMLRDGGLQLLLPFGYTIGYVGEAPVGMERLAANEGGEAYGSG